jgi:hypothetical protein
MTDEEIERHNKEQIAKHGRGFLIHIPSTLAAKAAKFGMPLDGYLITARRMG